LDEALAQSRALNHQLQEELKQAALRADLYNPEFQLESMEHERRDMNEIRAMSTVGAYMTRVSGPTAAICFELARHHLSLYPDREQSIHVFAARRLARVAALLSPQSLRFQTLVQELDAVCMARGLVEPRIVPSWEDGNALDPARYGGGVPADSATLAQLLRDRAREAIEAGHFITAERLAYRARSIAMLDLGERDPLTNASGLSWARSLSMLGQPLKGRDEVDRVLSILDREKSSDNDIGLVALNLRAQLLLEIGDDQGALAAATTLMSKFQRLRPVDHPDMISTHLVYAQALNAANRHDDALREVSMAISSIGSSPSGENVHSFAARQIHVSVLLDLKRSEDALAEIDKIAAPSEALDENHPYRLSLEQLRLRALRNLGKYAEAFAAVGELVGNCERSLPTDHPYTLASKFLRAQLLADTGQDKQALAEASALIPIVERVRGPNHRETRAVRELVERLKSSQP
jgi:hypothetical protein